VSQTISVFGSQVTPVAALTPPLVIPVLALSGFVEGLGATVHSVNQVSVRQSVTPDQLLGRMNASVRVITWDAMPLGGVAGGLLGSWLGLVATLYIAGIGSLLGAGWIWFSPLHRTPTIDAATEWAGG
jgi:predicted MFS family arabinose efflux permease